MLQKYFIAIIPPEPLLSDIYQLKKDIYTNYGTKGALNSPAHITLHMPFIWEEEKEFELLNCLADLKFDTELNVDLKNFSCFEPRVVYIDIQENEQLCLLQKKLVQHVKKTLHLFNQSDSLRGFHPHITIAFRDLKKSIFYKIWDIFKDEKKVGNFTCNSVCLLKQDGQQWEVYKEFHFKK